MKFNINKILTLTIMVAGAFALLTSCNKDVEDAKPIIVTAPSGQSINDMVNSDPTLTFLKVAVARAGTPISSLLSDVTGVFTFFAPTNTAFMASGIPDTNTIKAMPAALVETILRYHIVGGQKITGALIPSTFPNLQLPTQFVLAPPSASLPPGLRMSVFPSKRGTSFWANNIPLTQTDIEAANGVIHKTAALLSPPATTMKGYFAANSAKYSLLLEAVKRADSGLAVSTGLARLDSLLNFALANLTCFAPNNDAFRALFPPGTPDAAIIAALNTHALFSVKDVQGIVYYHLLGSRAFSVNFAAGPAPVNTVLAIPPANIPVPVIVTYGGATFTVKDVRPTSPPANVLTRDVHAINGVIHEIGQVLQPK